MAPIEDRTFGEKTLLAEFTFFGLAVEMGRIYGLSDVGKGWARGLLHIGGKVFKAEFRNPNPRIKSQ